MAFIQLDANSDFLFTFIFKVSNGIIQNDMPRVWIMPPDPED